MNEDKLDIANVSKASGVPASTLRYYEEKGLIRSIGRNGLRRVFDFDVFERLSLISLGKIVGFSLDEIKTMLTPGGPVIDREKLAHKADELDSKIKQLTVMRDGLRHAVKCPKKNHMDCSKFRRILSFASKRVIFRS